MHGVIRNKYNESSYRHDVILAEVELINSMQNDDNDDDEGPFSVSASAPLLLSVDIGGEVFRFLSSCVSQFGGSGISLNA